MEHYGGKCPLKTQAADKIIIGAGLYGLYSALYCAKRGQNVLVLEMENAPFKRATYINQARVHMGYHYPRSLSTAVKSAGYFKRFVEDYGFSILTDFDQVYATSSHFSWTDAAEFMKFCRDADIPCTKLEQTRFFREGLCDGAFLTKEYTYDAFILRDYFVDQLAQYDSVKLLFGKEITRIVKESDRYCVVCAGDEEFTAPFVLNATYASVNQILNLVEGVDTEDFGIKYELCEIILCTVSKELKDVGLTVMDGPFFSIMPFGKTGYHSLTSVTFTPHEASFETMPKFPCMEHGNCTKGRLSNCNDCPSKPASAWPYMSSLARKYMNPELAFEYEKSLFSMKPILKASEIDDSRPTLIRKLTGDVVQEPTFISVLSGKINTVYDLDPFLD